MNGLVFVLQLCASNTCLVSLVLGRRVGWSRLQGKKKEERGRVITHPENQAVQRFRNLNTLFPTGESKNAAGSEMAESLVWTHPNCMGVSLGGELTAASGKG